MGGRLSSLALAVISVSVYHLAQRAMPDSVRPAPLFTLVYGVGFVALALAAATGGPLGGLGEISSVATHWAPWLLAASVIGIELGVYAMYRNGWELTTGNITTQAIVAAILVLLGLTFFGESLTPTRTVGLVLCVIGAALLAN